LHFDATKVGRCRVNSIPHRKCTSFPVIRLTKAFVLLLRTAMKATVDM